MSTLKESTHIDIEFVDRPLTAEELAEFRAMIALRKKTLSKKKLVTRSSIKRKKGGTIKS
jgi:hypothetical protein